MRSSPAASGCVPSWSGPRPGLFGVSSAAAMRAAAAIEVLHTYSLVHDDLPCMDDDVLRRGKPTTHVQFDEATAVLAGDGLLTFAFEILADPATHAFPAVRCQLIAGLARAAGSEGHGRRPDDGHAGAGEVLRFPGSHGAAAAEDRGAVRIRLRGGTRSWARRAARRGRR